MSNELVVDLKLNTETLTVGMVNIADAAKVVEAGFAGIKELASGAYDAIDSLANHTGFSDWVEMGSSALGGLKEAFKSIPGEIVGMNETFTDFGELMGKYKGHFKTLKNHGVSTFGALTGAIKNMPKTLKISLLLVGAEVVGRALAWVADQISAAHDRGMKKIVETAEKEKQAFEDIRFIRDSYRKKNKDEYAVFMKWFQDYKQKLKNENKDYGQAAMIISAKLQGLKKDLEDAASADEKFQAGLDAQNERVKNLSKRYGLYTGTMDELHAREAAMVLVWAKSGKEILSNSDSAKIFLSDLKFLEGRLGGKLDDGLKEFIKILEQTEKKLKMDKAIKAYAKSLGFLKKENIAKEMTLMTEALKRSAEQYKNNPKLITPLIKGLEKLRVEAKQVGLEFPEALNSQEAALKKAADAAGILYGEQAALKQKSNELVVSWGYLTEKGLGELNTEANVMVAAYNEIKKVAGDNIVVSDEMKASIQGLLDKYIRLKKIAPETFQKMAEKLKITDSASEKAADSSEKMSEEAIEAAANYEKFGKQLVITKEQWDKLTTATQKNLVETAKSETAMKKLMGAMGNFTQGLTDLGIISEDTNKIFQNIGQGIGTMSTGFKTLAVGLATQNPLEMIAGGAQIVAGLGKILSGVFEKDWGAEAKRALSGLPGVTSGMTDKLEKMAKEMKSTQKAFRALLAEFVEGAKMLDAGDFYMWAEEVSMLADTVMEKADEYLRKQQAFEDEKKKRREDGPGRAGQGPPSRDGDDVDELARRFESAINAKNKLGEELTNLGNAFEQLVKRADEFKSHGSEAMLEIIGKARQLKEEGILIPEVFEYVNAQLKEGVTALGDYLKGAGDVAAKIVEARENMAGLTEGTTEWEEANEALLELKTTFDEISNAEGFARALEYTAAFMSALETEGKSMIEIVTMMGDQLDALTNIGDVGGYESGALSELLGLRQFVKDNEEVMTSITASQKMMESFANTGNLTAGLFKTFQDDTLAYYNQLTEAGAEEKNVLQALAPMLAKQVWYARQNKLELDEGTQAMVDQALQYGINMDVMLPPGEKMVSLLEELVRVLGGSIPYAVEQTARAVGTAFTDIDAKTGQWSDSLADVETQIRKNLTGAIEDFDDTYTDAMTGHSIVTETEKWQLALKNVEETISKDLEARAIGLDSVFGAVMHRLVYYSGELSTKLKETAEEGGDLQEVFDEYALKIGITAEQLKKVLDIAAGQIIVISDEMQAKIDELTETMGDAHAAESTLMGEIIRNAEITVNNFDTYAQRTRDILDDYRKGILDLKQTQEAMGSAFSELLKKAQELGLEGSKQMIGLLRDARAAGLEIGAMQDYVNAKLKKGIDALDKYISSFKSTATIKDEWKDLNDQLADNLDALEKVEAEMHKGGKTQEELNELRKEANRLEKERAQLLGDTIAKENELGANQKEIAENWNFMQAAALSTFKALEAEGHSFVEIVGMMDGQLTSLAQMAEENGLSISGGLEKMIDMAGFIEQHDGLAKRIEATRTMMEALGDTGYMENSDFTMFAEQTKSQFDDIIAKGGDSEMALRLMAPALSDINKYAESYGYTIDDNTQALIDQAREQGLLTEQQKTDGQITNDILLLIAETLGAVIPDSLKEMTGAVEKQQETFSDAAGAMKDDLSGLGQTAVEKSAEVQEGLKTMTDKEALDEYTQAMLLDIEETRNEMATLGESAMLTDDHFAEFSQSVQEQFKNIAGKTGDSETALRLLGPALEDITAYSEAYGFAIDKGTQSLIDQAKEQEDLAQKTEDGTSAANEHLVEMAEKYGLEIPESLRTLTDKVQYSMVHIKEKTGDWNSSLDDVEGKIKEDLPKAIKDLDEKYTDAMTGHSIVTETKKWKSSLEDVEHILGRELLETAESLDKKYKHVSGNIYEYLQRTSKGGYIARMSFDGMVAELERVKNAYDKMALKKRLSDKDKDLMADYKRRAEELSEAIEETAPTLENFGKKFEEFQDKLSGDIGVNRGMIEIARGLRQQGQSLDEIDGIIDKSLTRGSKGLGAWVNALGPAQAEIEELKTLQEEINELRKKEELEEEELLKLQEKEDELMRRRTGAQRNFLDDQAELLNTQDMVVAYFHSMRAEGKSVSEIMELMGDSFDNLAAKSMAELTGEAGFEMTNAFSNLYSMQRKMADNQDIVDGVEGLTQALHGMGDSMLYMSDQEFGRFQTSASNAFNKLKAAGFDQHQSLQLIAPMLRDLESYAEEYGFSLDRSTAGMLRNAKESGVLREKQKSDTEKLIEVNENLAGVMERLAGSLENLGKVSPFAQLADEAEALQTQTARLKGLEHRRTGVSGDIDLAKNQAQRLIDDIATAGGVSTDTGAGLFSKLLLKEDELEKLLAKQADIEKEYRLTKARVERLQKEYDKNMPKEDDYVSAALGYHGILQRDKWFRLHRGEQVDVWTPEETRKIQATPIRRMNLSDQHPAGASKGDIVFEHITIQSENGDETVKEFMTAVKGNKYGVQNLIRKVAN